MAEYRALNPNEAPPVALWEEVFRVAAPFFTSLLGNEDLSFAALEEGEVVSSVHVFMRDLRDREGRPLRVGGIGSVCTRKDCQKRGHSGRLLEMAIQGMERAGCVWSLLGTGVNDHYARYGWRTVSTPNPWGVLRFDVSGEAEILLPDDATLDEMAPLYEEATRDRPLATVRTERLWRTAVRYRLEPKKGFVVGARRDGRLIAYVAVGNPWGKWAFAEAAGDVAQFPALFATAAGTLREKGVEQALCLLPEGPARAAFGGVVERIHLAESRSEMLRPIADRIAWPDLFALYGDPRGRTCLLDAF